MYKLGNFELALRKEYECSIIFVHCLEAQEIIDRVKFTLVDLTKFMLGNHLVGPRESFFSQDHFAFNANVITASSIVTNSFGKISYVLCPDMPALPVTYVFAFPKFNEEKYIDYLKRLEKLKAFL